MVRSDVETHDNGRWHAGDVAVIRYRRKRPAELIIPARIVHDDDDYIAYYIAAGTPIKVQATRDGQPLGRDISLLEREQRIGGLRDTQWTGNHCLNLHLPSRMSTIRLFWREADWSFVDFYGNIEAPLQRCACGFDTADYLLDVVVSPDLTWRWKDEDEWELAREHQFIARDILDDVRREGEQIIADAEARAWPFNAGFEAWRPDPAWTIPSLPANWDAGLIYPD